MSLSVFTNNRFTNQKMVDLYNNTLIKISDTVLYNTKFGTNSKYSKAKFIRVKNLVEIISDEFYKDTYSNKNKLDILLNKFNDVLKN